jgi:hypothetical protein
MYESKDGATPDAIQSYFPTLSLEQIYGAIAFYLGKKDGGGSVRNRSVSRRPRRRGGNRMSS